ncbi:MAG: ATP-binding protein [Promethearchaeati archaeon]
MLEQADCLDRATDLMMGLRTGEIAKIKSALKNRGQLTDTRMEISSAGGKSSAGKQLESAESLLKDIDEYYRSVQESEIPKLESRIIELSGKLKELRREEDELEKARKIAKLEKLRSAYKQGCSSLEELEQLPEKAIERAKESRKKFSETRYNRDTLTNRIQWLNRVLAASLVFAGLLGLFAIIRNANLFGFVQSLIWFIAFLALLAYRWQVSNQLDAIENSRVTLLKIANELGSDTEDVSQADEFVDQKVKEMETTEQELTESIGALKSRLAIGSISDEKALKRAEMAIQERERNIDTSIDRKYDENEYESIREDIRKKEGELGDLQKKNQEHKDVLRGFDKRFGSLLFDDYLGRPAEYSPSSIDSLLRVMEELEEFISVIKNEAERCRLAIEIMDSLAAEEKKKVSDLLSENSRASEIFSEITEERYSEIIYNPGKEEIRAVKQDGTEMPVLNLSRGAKDQLYLSIRLALAERILKGDSGFFILDDPFLASDLKRREIQIETLEKMVEQGWQVLYFSANRNLAEKFKSRFGHKYRTLPPLE